MQDLALRVGEQLVIQDHVRLTILSVEGGRVVFGIMPDPKGVRGPAASQWRPPPAAAAVPLPGDN
jgi:hypothetical protein